MAFHLSGLFNQLNTQAPAGTATANPAAAAGSTEETSGAGLKMIQNMLAGDIFSGKVLGISENNVLLQMADGSAFSARLSSESSIQIGQNLTFLVEENRENTISLKPMMTMEQQAVLIGKALDAAEFPATDDNIQIVKELLNLNMPINAHTISAMVKNSLKFPDTSLNTMANLIRLEMPVTAENIGQFEAYKHYEHSILSELNGFGRELINFSAGIGSGTDKSAAAQKLDILDTLIRTFYEGRTEASIQGQPVNAYLDGTARDFLAQQLSAAFTETLGITGTVKDAPDAFTDVRQLMQDIQNGQLPTGELLLRLTGLFKSHPEAQKQMGMLFQSDEMNMLLLQMADETLKLTPADVARADGIQNYYKRLRETLNKVQETAGKEPFAAAIGKELASLSSNIDFMNDLNKNMTYFQMPIHFSESDANGELYVFTNKKALKNNAEHVRALLHLDMEHLGPMDIFVQLTGKNVSTNFCLESEALLDFVYSNIDRLNTRLEALGFSTKFEMKVARQEEGFDFMKDFIQKDQPVMTTSQYVFDIKA